MTRKSYKICKGPDFRLQRVKKHADLTKEMLEVHRHATSPPADEI